MASQTSASSGMINRNLRYALLIGGKRKAFFISTLVSIAPLVVGIPLFLLWLPDPRIISLIFLGQIGGLIYAAFQLRGIDQEKRESKPSGQVKLLFFSELFISLLSFLAFFLSLSVRPVTLQGDEKSFLTQNQLGSQERGKNYVLSLSEEEHILARYQEDAGEKFYQVLPGQSQAGSRLRANEVEEIRKALFILSFQAFIFGAQDREGQ